jgi:transposase
LSVTDYNELMKVHEQGLRTRIMLLEYAIAQHLSGNEQLLAQVYSNEWIQPMKETGMNDPFAGLRKAAEKRREAQHEWQSEVRAAHAAGFSLRAVAEIAGVSHDTVWRTVK